MYTVSDLGKQSPLFDHPVPVIQLGYLSKLDTLHVTLQDPLTGLRRMVLLQEAQYDLLESIDPSDPDRCFTDQGRGLLIGLETMNVVRLMPEHRSLSGFDFIPVPRRDIGLKDVMEYGYRFDFGTGSPFITAYAGAHLIQGIDGYRTLKEIAQQYMTEEASDYTDEVAEYDTDGTLIESCAFEQYISGEIYCIIRELAVSGAATFETAA